MFYLCLWCIYDIFYVDLIFLRIMKKYYFINGLKWEKYFEYVNLCLLILIYKCVVLYIVNEMEI